MIKDIYEWHRTKYTHNLHTLTAIIRDYYRINNNNENYTKQLQERERERLRIGHLIGSERDT